MAAYFGADAEKACDALVSDLLKDEDDAGETDVPEERMTLNESEEERRSPSGPPGLHRMCLGPLDVARSDFKHHLDRASA